MYPVPALLISQGLLSLTYMSEHASGGGAGGEPVDGRPGGGGGDTGKGGGVAGDGSSGGGDGIDGGGGGNGEGKGRSKRP